MSNNMRKRFSSGAWRVAGLAALALLAVPASSQTLPEPIKDGVVGRSYQRIFGYTQPLTSPVVWSISSIPPGLTWSQQTSPTTGQPVGVLSGIPTTIGTYYFTVSFIDYMEKTGSAYFSLTIRSGITIVTSSLATGTQNVPYQQTVQAIGGLTPYSWTATGLPPGLTMSAGGVISGTPTTAGTYSVTATVTDNPASYTPDPPQTASKTFSLIISPPITITTSVLPTATVGLLYTPFPMQAIGGSTPYTWTATGIPPGMSLNLSGTLSGTPTTAGTYNVAVSVSDASPQRLAATRTIPLTVVSGLTISPATLPSGAVNTPYPPQTMQATGGKAPYTWSATGLPPGLILTTAGALSGTPTAAGTYNATVTVADGSVPQLTASKTYAIAILQGLTIVTATLPGGLEGIAYGPVALQVQGGTAPYVWTAQGLPAGMSLSTSGSLSGTPAAAGTFNFSVTVTDSTLGARLSASRQLSLTVVGAQPQLSCRASAFTITLGTAFSATCTITAGVAPYKLTATGLTGIVVSDTAQTVNVTPTAPGNFVITITATDSRGQASKPVVLGVTVLLAPEAIALTLAAQVQSPTDQPTLVLNLNTATPVQLTGRLTLSFRKDASVTNVPADYRDPAAMFSNRQTTLDFTIPADSRTAVLPANGQFSQGTVAGELSVQVTSLNAPTGTVLPVTLPAAQILRIAPAAPVITARGVQITNVTSTGFTVEVQGFSTTRALTKADFTFTPAAGAQLDGATVSVPFSGVDQTAWFGTQGSQPYGGSFLLRIPFSYSGDSAALGTVSVTLTNAQGTSAPVQGARQ